MAEPLRERLLNYMVGIVDSAKSKSYIINGPADHLHLLVSLSPDQSLSDFMRNLKSVSSKWVHETFPACGDFAWQEGYSAFSVSYTGRHAVHEYIKSQEEHHKKKSFVDELKQFLDAHQIEYNPKYLG